MGKGMELPCPLWVRHCPQISTCSPTWNLLELVLLSFYGGFVTWLIKALATDGWTQSPVLSFLLTLGAEGWREENESSNLLISLHKHTNDNVLRTSFSSVQFSSVAQSCPTLCDPMNRSMPGLPVHHQLLEFTQTHPSSQWCHPAISSSVVPYSSCPQSLPASGSFPTSQLFSWGGQSIGDQSFQWTPRTDLLQDGLVGSPCSPRDSQESSPTP